MILVQWSPLGSRRLSSYDMGSLRAARVAASYSKPCRACRWDCLRRAALMGKVDDGSSSGLECAFAATHIRTYIYLYVNIHIYNVSVRRRMDRALDLIHAADGPVYDM